MIFYSQKTDFWNFQIYIMAKFKKDTDTTVCVLVIGRSGRCQRTHFYLHQELFNLLKSFNIIFSFLFKWMYYHYCYRPCLLPPAVARRALWKRSDRPSVRPCRRFVGIGSLGFLNFNILLKSIMELCVTQLDLLLIFDFYMPQIVFFEFIERLAQYIFSGFVL